MPTYKKTNPQKNNNPTDKEIKKRKLNKEKNYFYFFLKKK